LWGGHYGGGSSKERNLLQLTPNKCVSAPCHRGFWLFTPTNGWFFSSLC
jgi:hypothetical protein